MIIWQPTLIDLATMKYEDLLFANKPIVRFAHTRSPSANARCARKCVSTLHANHSESDCCEMKKQKTHHNLYESKEFSSIYL